MLNENQPEIVEKLVKENDGSVSKETIITEDNTDTAIVGDVKKTIIEEKFDIEVERNRIKEATENKEKALAKKADSTARLEIINTNYVVQSKIANDEITECDQIIQESDTTIALAQANINKANQL